MTTLRHITVIAIGAALGLMLWTVVRIIEGLL